MDFACVYALTQQADRRNTKILEREEQKMDFDYFGIISIDSDGIPIK